MPRRAVWHWAAIGLVVVLMAGLGVYLLNRGGTKKSRPLNGDDLTLAWVDEPTDDPVRETKRQVADKSADPADPAPKMKPPPKQWIVEQPAKDPPQRENPPPPMPAAPPAPEIIRVVPEQPRSGGRLTISLTGKDSAGKDNAGKAADIEYRIQGQATWKKADRGLVELTDLPAPSLTIEFRVVDSRGRPSPILARTWHIEPKLIAQPLQLEWKLKPGDRFFQELRVLQKPAYNIQGIPFSTVLEYVVVSSFKVAKAGASGYEIQQKVEGAQLVQADALLQPLLAPAILKLPGTSFAIHLDAKMEVKQFEAAGLPPAVMAQGALGLQVGSLLDQDGWKEMARTTFFQPNRPLKQGAKWSEPMTHSWGALGSWSGRIHYAYGGGKGALHQFAFGLDLNYQAPKRKAGAGMLAISSAAFKAQQAGGVILFDADKGKVVEARERFLVRGRLAMQLLGQNVPADLEEDQHFHLRIIDVNPLKK